jgi:hypothetical protein
LRTSFAAVGGDLLVLCDQPTTAALQTAKWQIQDIVTARRRSIQQQRQQQANESESERMEI